jgi:hypothetical protein
MAMKFYGELDQLRTLLQDRGIVGTWQSEPNGVEMLRCADGSNLHWARKKKSLWIDGKAPARDRLTRDVIAVLGLMEVTSSNDEW